MSDAQNNALKTFPRTFLNLERVSQMARDGVLKKFRTEAMIFVGLIGVLFTVIQLVLNSTYRGSMLQANDEFGRMRTKVEILDERLQKIENKQIIQPVNTPILQPVDKLTNSPNR
jgi:hypothetical protein